MTDKLLKYRVQLAELLAAVVALGASRELSLAVTSLQSGRMLLGNVAGLLGSPTPYPQADNPASPEVREHSEIPPAGEMAAEGVSPVAAVKTVRSELQVLIDEMRTARRDKWPRDYGSLEERLYDRALGDVILAKGWLGEQLAVIAGQPLVKAHVSAKMSQDMAIRTLAELSPDELVVSVGVLLDRLAVLSGVPTPVPGLVRAEGIANLAKMRAGVSDDEAARDEAEDIAAEDKVMAQEREITVRLQAGQSIASISRDLDVTPHRVTKIRDKLVKHLKAQVPTPSKDAPASVPASMEAAATA